MKRKGKKSREVTSGSVQGDLPPHRHDADRAYSNSEYQRAIDLYTTTLSSGTPCAAVFNNRGLSYFALGDYERAVDDFSRAIELEPGFINAWNNRGLTYQKMGEVEKAAQDFYTADDLDPDYSLEGTHVMPKLVTP